MAAIKTSFGSGGSSLTPGGTSTPTLATALRDIADDLAAVKVATIASDDATDLSTALTLVNEIKAALNAIAAETLATTKG